MKAKKNKNENDAIAWMKRMKMSVRMKKRQLINHRFRSVFHSAFVTTKIEKSNFYSDINTLIDSKFTTKKLLEKKK
jgi:hypothetical protein